MKKTLLLILLAGFVFTGGCIGVKYQVPLTEAEPMPTEYKIGPGDVVWIEFRMHPEFNRQLTVGPHGKITLPAVGEYTIFNKTTDEISKELGGIYEKMFAQPDVIITVVGYNSKVVYVIGETMRPGIVPYTREMRLVDAVMLAGGPSLRAAKDRIRLVRPGATPRIFVCNFDKGVRKGEILHNPHLQYGDIVWVDGTWFTEAGYALNRIAFPVTALFSGVEQSSSTRFTLMNWGRGGLGR